MADQGPTVDEARHALAATTGAKRRAQRLDRPYWPVVVACIVPTMAVTATPHPAKVGVWAALSVALVAYAGWRLRTGTYRPRIMDGNLWNVASIGVLFPMAIGGVVPLPSPYGPLLAGLVVGLGGFILAYLLTRVALWRAP